MIQDPTSAQKHSEIDFAQFPTLEYGLLGYGEALETQLKLHKRVKSGELIGALMLLEHSPVITRGASAKAENILVSESQLQAMGVELVTTDRGGDATYHGPGQIVGYPIVNLRAIKSDVHGFLRLIEETIISTLADFGLCGHRNGPAGVWVGEKKICSIGIAVRGGVTYHGFALNVKPNLEHFLLINPCGLNSSQIVSMEKLLSEAPNMIEVRESLRKSFYANINK